MAQAKEALKKQTEKKNEIKPTDRMNLILKRMTKEISRALPEQIKSERFQRIVLTAFSNNPKLQLCDPVSFIAAMMQSAQLGLEPNTPLGQAYLIPYKNSVQFQVGYKGMIDLAMRSGQYQSIYAHAVHENDEFDIDYGLEQILKHKPFMGGDRGKIIGYYAVYKLVNGGNGFAFMTKSEIEQHARKFSKTYSNGPWQTDFDAMAKKTVIKQVLKYAPMSIEIQKATSVDEKVTTSDLQKTEDAIDSNIIEAAFEYVDEETGEVVTDDKGDDFLGKDFKPIEGVEVQK